MNGIIKATLRASSLRGINVKFAQKIVRGEVVVSGQYQHARNFRHMCFSKPGSSGMLGVNLQTPGICNSENSRRFQHTKSEQELVQFLAEEITAECKAVKMKTLPTKIDDFEVKLDGAEVTLTKSTSKERISVNFNVNHTVDTDEEQQPEINPNMEKPDIGELKSKPAFEVDIQMGDQTLSFSCSFLPPADTQQSEYNDLFGIDEITVYKGEWSDKTYAVAGEVIDGCFYDLLMNLLEEKGISNEFVQKLSDFSTGYEHSLYIALLENTKKFVSGK